MHSRSFFRNPSPILVGPCGLFPARLCCQTVKMAEGSGEPCAAAVCAPGALHRHLRSLRTRALVALSWPGPNLPISAQSRRCLADNLSAW